jgi:outer membrane protein
MSSCRRKKSTFGLVATSLVLVLVVSLPARAMAARRLSLADALALAKSRRSESVQAAIDVKLAGVDVLRAGLQRVHLTLDANYSDGYQRLNIGATAAECGVVQGACSTDGHEQLFVSTAALSIPVWSGLAVEAAWSRANRLVDAAEARRRSAWRSIELETASAYWAVRRAELLVDTNVKAHERSSQVVAITKARVDAGIAPAVDYMRARSSMLIEEAEISDLQGQSDDARAQLGSALQIDEPIVLTEVPSERNVVLAPLGEIVAQAERRRPEVVAAQATFDAQKAQVRITSGAFWPQLSLFGNADAQNQFLGIPQSNIVGTFSAGVKVDWQIFDSLSTYTAYQQEKLTAERFAEDRRRVVYVVRAEVQSAYMRMKAALERRGPLADALQVARAGLELIQRRYEAGTALVIEVLQAQTDLRQVELSLVNNAIDVSLLQTTLDAARGAL